MKIRVVISDNAKAQLAEQIAYIRDRNPQAAREQKAKISKSVNSLRQSPRLGKPGRVENTRELVIYSTPYILIYELEAACINILNIYHGSTSWTETEEGEEE